MDVMLDRRYIKKRKKISIVAERIFVSAMNLGRHRPVPAPNDVKSILIVRHNQLGDAVVASPMIAAVREIWPNARVEVLAGNDNYEAFSWVDGVDKVLLMPSGEHWWKRVRFYRSLSGRFDIVFQTLLDEHYFSRAMAARAMAGRALVVGRGRGSPLEELYDRRPLIPVGSSVGQLFALLGPFTKLTPQEMVARHPRHRVKLSAPAMAAARNKLTTLRLSPQAYVALNISARVDFRELGVEQAAGIATGLLQKGLPVLLLYSPADQARAEAIRALVPEILLADSNSLGEAMALAQLARLYVGADTGTAHFAAAGQVPCVVLFSYKARADIWSPYGVPFVSIQANQDQPVCNIDDDLVLAFAERLLAGERLTMIVKAAPRYFSCGSPRMLASVA
jgi:ADP-heptose:LPS heptosyltransferase